MNLPKKVVLEALAKFRRSQSANPEYDLVDHLQNALAEVWPERQEHRRPLEMLDPADDEAFDWVTKHLCGIRRDNGSMDYGLTALVRTYQSSRNSAITARSQRRNSGMGSVMDQDRPWERERKRETIRERIKDSLEFSNQSAIEQIIDELERLEAAVIAMGGKTTLDAQKID